jgi:aerobic-type carbon monoxide dehydrogenase small subunit (CoxS/CutS family)
MRNCTVNINGKQFNLQAETYQELMTLLDKKLISLGIKQSNKDVTINIK